MKILAGHFQGCIVWRGAGICEPCTYAVVFNLPSRRSLHPLWWMQRWGVKWFLPGWRMACRCESEFQPVWCSFEVSRAWAGSAECVGRSQAGRNSPYEVWGGWIPMISPRKVMCASHSSAGMGRAMEMEVALLPFLLYLWSWSLWQFAFF